MSPAQRTFTVPDPELGVRAGSLRAGVTEAEDSPAGGRHRAVGPARHTGQSPAPAAHRRRAGDLKHGQKYSHCAGIVCYI